MSRSCWALVWTVAFVLEGRCGLPIALHPENLHYFLFHGQATILISSGEHYGAVLNLDFDFKPYLEELHPKRLNLTRTFSGAYVEPSGAFQLLPKKRTSDCAP